MKNLKDALSFLTIVKFYSDDFDAVGAMNAFAYVGLLIGCVLAGVYHLLGDSFVMPIAVVVLWVVLTGALHLDGVMDTADALFSHRDRERKLEIMKDSRSGAMAVVTAILLILIKYESISQLSNFWLLIVIPGMARAGMVWTMKTMPYVRAEGTGKMFFESENSAWMYQFVPVLVLALFLGLKPALMLIAVLCATVLILQWWYRKQIGGITGDLLGAQCEVTETVLLLFAGALL